MRLSYDPSLYTPYVELGPNDHWVDAPHFMLAFELHIRYKNEVFMG